VAVRFFFAVRPPADWRRRLTGVGLIVLGLVGVGVAGWAYLDAWTTRQGWEASPEAAALARQNAEPTPIWIAASTPEPAAARIEPLPAPEPVAAPEPPAVPEPPAPAPAEPTPPPAAAEPTPPPSGDEGDDEEPPKMTSGDPLGG